MTCRSLIIISFICAILLPAAYPGFCQDFPMQHYTVEDGLPSNTVYEIYRDSKGLLWFATDKGVARYNGLKFETFTTFNGLPDNEVFFFQEDLYGRLWLATYNGELCYYKDDTFHSAANTPFLKLPFKAPFINRICVQSDSSVSICFNEQFKFLDVTKDKLSTYDPDIGARDIGAYKIFRVKKKPGKRFDLTLSDKVLSIDEHSKIMDTPEVFKEKRIECLVCQNKEYYYGKNSVLSPHGDVLWSFKKFHFFDYTLNRIFLDSNKIFFAGSNGLIINDSIIILKGEKVSSITQDNTGNYFVSTLNNGVYTISHHLFRTNLFNKAYENNIVFSSAQRRHARVIPTNTIILGLLGTILPCLYIYKI